MAIYRLSAQVVKRSAGSSVVACAAYRAGESLDDERTGQTFDYTRKRGVLHEAIITPENAPAWMADREQLWNGVEAVEKRVDARLAREVQLALPHELTDAQRAELVENFVRDEFVSRGR
jgi:ATP-dependent exoDNAse (exonuclease V) alpha subunit